jgi:hypothetical protein
MAAPREIGERVLELLGRIDPRDPQWDQDRITDRVHAYVAALGAPTPSVRFASDARALKRSRTWPQTDRGAWRPFSSRQSRLLDAPLGGVWAARLPRRGGQGTELGSLVERDEGVLERGLGRSRYVYGVRHVTRSLERLARELASGSVLPPPRHVDALIPLAEAAAAGLFTLNVGQGYDGDLVALVRPRMRLDAEGRLHDWDGALAVEWPNGEGYYFWHGVEMPPSIGRDPDALTPMKVMSWANAERRRVGIERIGLERFLQGVGAEVIQEDDYGRLWRTTRRFDGEAFVAVEVVNSTAEPDGSYRRYFLRVPPGTRTARRGVAWSFGLTRKAYVPAVES